MACVAAVEGGNTIGWRPLVSFDEMRRALEEAQREDHVFLGLNMQGKFFIGS